jgi:ABC-2 type transport system permease protein
VISQFWGLYVREVLRTFRNPFVLAFTIISPFMWLIFFGSSFSNDAQFLNIGTGNYIAFLLPGVLSTSMLSIGMFGSMSTIQDKRFGFMKRILITPTSKGTVFLAKAFGAATRGMIQIPVMIVAALIFGVTFHLSALEWLAWLAGLLALGVGFCSLFLSITATSTDWQTPGVVSNFITLPLMFSSTYLFPNTNFPSWLRAISDVNPITFSTELGRSFVLGGGTPWVYLGYLVLFGLVLGSVGYFISARWLKIE